MWSDDKRPGVNGDGPPVATSTPTPSIDDDVPHFQPPDDHDDGPSPSHPQLSPTMNVISQPRVDASVPAVFFFYLSIYHLLFLYLGTA